jgi:protein-disulfide isomerase
MGDTELSDSTEMRKAMRTELRYLIEEEGVLDRAIERGIRKFIERQRAIARADQQRSSSERAKNVRPVSKEEYVYGNPGAEVTLVEYSDFECPFCKRFHPTAKRLVDESDGKVNWVYRHFPLANHNPGAQKQAEASECAGKQGGAAAFWRYSDLIYARTSSNGNGFPLANLVPLAKEIGLDDKTFRRCVDSAEMAAKVKADYENGIASGITGTPGSIFLHNASGKAIAMAGALPLARLQAAVKALSDSNDSQ